MLIDTNVLVLLVVGLAEPSRIPDFSRTRGYDPSDYAVLRRLLSGFRNAATTPHILSQASDLLRQSNAWGVLAESLVAQLSKLYLVTDEIAVPARNLAKARIYARFGLADAAVFDAARRGCTVLTDDLPLHNVLLSLGCTSVNFTEFRELLPKI